MAYSVVGIIAIFVHLLVNLDVFIKLRGKNRFSGEKFYLLFLVSAITYHITDAFWGFLYDAKLVVPLFIDTSIYFLAMASSILLWGFFVFYYLGNKKFKYVMLFGGFGFFALQVAAIIINIFLPVLFTIDKDTCAYSAQPARYATLGIQILAYLIITVATLYVSFKATSTRRIHNLAIALFSIFMIIFIALQVFFPLLPMYSIGYLAGITGLHTFVIRDEFIKQQMELEMTKKEINIDPLTGVYNKHAYIDEELDIDRRIGEGNMEDFALVIFDLNNLKKTNDSSGHEAGDNYIIKATQLISTLFPNTPVYRVGGDEFIVILTKDNYKSRHDALKGFNQVVDENLANNDINVVAAGISDYNKEEDTNILQIFRRADAAMYDRKRELKNR